MKTRDLYGILIRYPRPGGVKTRLAREIGGSRAAAEYREMAEEIMRDTAQASRAYERIVFFSPAGMEKEFGEWLPGESLMPQSGTDIGEIMRNVIADLFSSGAERVVITGSDIPGLGQEIIEGAFAALGGTDIVIGPAEDGGYYLIGMKKLHEEVFRDIRWGTSGVFDETVTAISRAGLSYKTVRVLRDVDTLEDLERSKNSCP